MPIKKLQAYRARNIAVLLNYVSLNRATFLVPPVPVCRFARPWNA